MTQSFYRPTSFDPRTQPVVPAAQLPALPAERLTLDHIRQAFAAPVSWQVEPLFAQALSVLGATQSQARRAAVLLPIAQGPQGRLQVIFTRRSDALHHHAGQISFPGGCIETADVSPVSAALRETTEEIGVEPGYVHVLGTQPALLTTTGFFITPVVGELLAGFQMSAQHAEVAEIFEVPLAVLMDPASYELRQMQTEWGHGRYFYAVPWGPHFIWGATALLLRNLYHFLAASFSQTMR